MLPVLWHPEALEDLEDIIGFIEARNRWRRIGSARRSAKPPNACPITPYL
jgi:plasmid stabilization system protein ParE